MITYSEINDPQLIKKLWNNEMGFIYPLSNQVFTRNVLNYQDKFLYGSYFNKALVGFVIAKKSNNDNLETYKNRGWISLLYVAKKFRKQGIGSNLLNKALDYLRDKSEIFVGQDIGNFFPGLPSDFNNLSDSWFSKRSFNVGRLTHDLINYHPQALAIKNTNFDFRVAKLSDKVALLELFKTFSERWYYEGFQYFEDGGLGDEYVLCCKDDLTIAFCRINDPRHYYGGYNINWHERFSSLGGIGPLGVHQDYRKIGLGKDIVSYAIAELKSRDIKEIIIDWTGLLEFYQQFGFEVWKTYKYISKKA